MHAIFAIAGKETRVFLTTWTSYVLFGAFILITAFFFHRQVIEYQAQTLQILQMQQEQMLERLNLTDMVMMPLFLNITVFFLFMLPIMTMRLFAEERRTKTLELLMTVPVQPHQIVLGKYLAALLMMTLMLSLTLVFPILLHHFGGGAQGASSIDIRSVATAYLGMMLMGSAFVSIGLFASSLSESQVIAVVAGFAILMLFYVVGIAARGQEGNWASVLNYLSIHNHLDGFVRGLLRTPDLAYFFSLTFMGLFFTHQVVEAQRWS